MVFINTASLSISIDAYEPFLIFAKHVSYILLFFYVASSFTYFPISYKRLDNIIFYISLISIIYIIYQIPLDKPSYYGLGHISEPNNSSASGVIFYSLYFLSLVFYRFSMRYKWIITAFFLFWGCFLTGSRTSQFMLFILTVFYFYLYSSKHIRLFLILFSVLLFSSFYFYSKEIFLFLYENNYQDSAAIRGGLRRFASFFDIIATLQYSRIPFWLNHIRNIEFDFIQILFGCGLGCLHSINDGLFQLGLGADNGFLKSFIQVGLIGCLVFYGFIIKISVSHIKNDESKIGLLFACFCFTYLFAEISYEIFESSKGGGVFWFLAGIFVTDFFYKRSSKSVIVE